MFRAVAFKRWMDHGNTVLMMRLMRQWVQSWLCCWAWLEESSLQGAFAFVLLFPLSLLLPCHGLTSFSSCIFPACCFCLVASQQCIKTPEIIGQDKLLYFKLCVRCLVPGIRKLTNLKATFFTPFWSSTFTKSLVKKKKKIKHIWPKDWNPFLFSSNISSQDWGHL